jgi:hypothetical protein
MPASLALEEDREDQWAVGGEPARPLREPALHSPAKVPAGSPAQPMDCPKDPKEGPPGLVRLA